MRTFVYGLLAVFLAVVSLPAHAARTTDTIQLRQNHEPRFSYALEQEIALSQLVSPSMLWSQLEMDSLKAEGLNVGLPYAYSAETVIKSDLIRSFNVAQVESAKPQSFAHLKPLTFLMMFAAGFVMWLGLAVSRKY